MPDAVSIQIDRLRHVVDGRAVLDVERLALPRDGISVILGPNGAGKSVLLRLVHGIIPIQSGTIRFASPAPRQAMVFQRPVLLRRSVAANVRFALRASGQSEGRLDGLLSQAGLTDRARQPARSLSGGEQQRLAMVRALATAPEILFLDEPTANLDPQATLALEEMILAARDAGTKIIMVTHNLAQARRLAADLSILDQGRIIDSGPAARVFDAPATRTASEFLSTL